MDGGRIEPAPALAVRELGVRIAGRELLADVSFSVDPGRVLGVIGPSGAGKSTLLRCLNGLVRPTEGSVAVHGAEITALDERDLARTRRRIGMVFQSFALLSSATVAGNVELALRIAGTPRAARAARVRQLLELVGLAEHADRHPARLSGGQRQRVGIARALAGEPHLLLCDEATSALDTETTRSILALLRDLVDRLRPAVVVVTHDLSVIRAIADDVLVLDGGRAVESGSAARIIGDPQHAATRRIVSAGRPALPEVLRRRRPQPGPGCAPLLRLEPRGPDAFRPLLHDVAAIAGHPPILLHGGVEHVGREALGSLWLALPGASPADADRVLRTIGVPGAAEGFVDAS